MSTKGVSSSTPFFTMWIRPARSRMNSRSGSPGATARYIGEGTSFVTTSVVTEMTAPAGADMNATTAAAAAATRNPGFTGLASFGPFHSRALPPHN
jgi:hypothetical protein